MAAEIGVDRLSWEITDHPENMFSRRFVPGTPEFARIQYEIWDRTASATRSRARRRGRASRSAALVARSHRQRPVSAARAADRDPTRVTNLSTRAFPAHASYGRRLVRLGAQLCAADGDADQSRLRARLAAGAPAGRRDRARSDHR
jgi:hypothetical protein